MKNNVRSTVKDEDLSGTPLEFPDVDQPVKVVGPENGCGCSGTELDVCKDTSSATKG